MYKYLPLQVTANLVPLNSRRVAVRFDYFKIFNLVRHLSLINCTSFYQ